MDRNTFAERLHAASVAARDFARSLVLESLPDKMLFRVRLNQSYDGNPLRPNERLYPEDSVLNLTDKFVRCTEQEVVDLLWRDAQVPEWINIGVVAEKPSATIVGLQCCGRFTGDEQLLYHTREGWPPFHALGPVLPHKYENGQKFSIYTRSEALERADVDALKPHSAKVWSLELRGPGCDDHTLSNLPLFPAMEVLDLSYTAVTGPGFATLDHQPKLRVLKIFAPKDQLLDLERLPRIPRLDTLLVHNATSVALDFGGQLPKFQTLNHLDFESRGALRLDGSLPDSMWLVRLVGKKISGSLTCCKKVEHLSLCFPEADEAELRNFVRGTLGVRFLNLSTTPVSDAFVKGLLDRWPLDYLEISGAGVSDTLVKELVQVRPKLRVSHRNNAPRDGSRSTS